MRILTLLLIVLLGLLQYRLWFGQHSIADYFRQQEELKSQQASNLELEKRNRVLLPTLKICSKAWTLLKSAPVTSWA